MNKVLIHFVLAVIVSLPIFLFGQNSQLGVSVNGGGSWLTLSNQFEKGSNSVVPAAGLSFFYEHKVGKRWALGADLGFSFFGGEGQVEERKMIFSPPPVIIPGGPLSGNGVDVILVELPESSLPLEERRINTDEVTNRFLYGTTSGYAKWKGDIFSIQLGMQFMYLSTSKAERNGRDLIADEVPKFDFGLNPRFELKVANSLWLNSGFYLGFKNLVSDGNYFPRRNRQLFFGFNYYLTN